MQKLLTACFLMLAVSVLAQEGKKDLFQKGEIVLPDGKKIDCYIYFNYRYPDLYQNKVSYITADQYRGLEAGGKLKEKDMMKLKPTEADHYLMGGRKFKSVSYADLNAVGPATIPRKYFYELIAEGRISAYRRFSDDLVIKDNPFRMGYELLIFKDDKNAKNIQHIRLQESIKDNPEVLKKFNEGEYGRLARFSSIIHREIPVHSEFETDLLALLLDYNKTE